LDSG
jgi:Stabilization of polarity axis